MISQVTEAWLLPVHTQRPQTGYGNRMTVYENFNISSRRHFLFLVSVLLPPVHNDDAEDWMNSLVIELKAAWCLILHF